MATVEIQKIVVSLTNSELEMIKKALQHHINEEYDQETEMNTLLNDLRK